MAVVLAIVDAAPAPQLDHLISHLIGGGHGGHGGKWIENCWVCFIQIKILYSMLNKVVTTIIITEVTEITVAITVATTAETTVATTEEVQP